LAAVRERLRALLGEEKMLEVDATWPLTDFEPDETEQPGTGTPQFATREQQMRLWGFIGAPGVSRATRQDQHLFVNRRPVENRGLNAALIEAYHTALMKGRYPVCCLFLDIAPAEVDVNIHPTKREVKFRREAEVRQFVMRAVRSALLNFRAPQFQPAPDQKPQAPPGTAPTSVPPPEAQPAQPNVKLDQPKEAPAHSSAPTPLRLESLPATPAPEQTALKLGFAQTRPAQCAPASTVPERAPAPEPRMPSEPVPLLDVPLRFVGVIGRLYVVFESDRGLVLLDQHAAHERVLFEQMLTRLEQGGMAPSQKLLLPETIELAPRDAQFVREHLDVLVRLGVGLSEFGERTFLLDALPPFVKVNAPRQFVLDLVDELKAAGRELSSARLGEQAVAKTVCKLAVKAHDPLSEPELERLVEDLRRCAMPYTCPHGRPTLIEINYRELERKFGRAA
ncbi:MAG: DNA mismatch repair endonuclease MutL, partial [Verrucomicrobiales bacterium]|nr:DNA mismatch repair endonuclease MutL [Verrucomicrobiales bacterium]